jgi:hypothetical protein
MVLGRRKELVRIGRIGHECCYYYGWIGFDVYGRRI